MKAFYLSISSFWVNHKGQQVSLGHHVSMGCSASGTVAAPPMSSGWTYVQSAESVQCRLPIITSCFLVSTHSSGVCGLKCRGHSFFSTNEELLDRYAKCPGSAEVIAVQTSYLDALHAAPRAVPGVPQDVGSLTARLHRG